MSEVRTHSVYVLSDSRTPNVIRYVGRSIDVESRLKQHKRPGGLSKKDSWIADVMSEGGDIRMSIIRGGMTRHEAIESEKTAIKLMFLLGYDLVNTSGFSEAKYSAEKVSDDDSAKRREAAMIEADAASEISTKYPPRGNTTAMNPPRNALGFKGVTKSSKGYVATIYVCNGPVRSGTIYDLRVAAGVFDIIASALYDGRCFLNMPGIEPDGAREEAISILNRYISEFEGHKERHRMELYKVIEKRKPGKPKEDKIISLGKTIERIMTKIQVMRDVLEIIKIGGLTKG